MNQTSRFRSSGSEERRGYARIIDAVGLDIRRLEPGESVAIKAGKDDVVAMPPGEWQPYADIDALRSNDSDAADHIELLESLLLKESRARASSSLACEAPTHKVSLSGSGIAFAHNLLLQPGDNLVLGLTFFPSLEYVKVLAMVISVGGSSSPVFGGKHAARAMFTDIDAEVREQIVQHIEFVQGEM